jgi:DNA-binding MarR family transcriptional regulator
LQLQLITEKGIEMDQKEQSQTHFQQVGVDIGQGRYHEEMVYGVALMYTEMFNEITIYLKKLGLNPTQMNALMLIKHQGKEEGLSQVDLGTRMMATAHNITRLLQKFQKDGLVERATYQKDGRVTIVRITPKGSLLLDEVWEGYDQKLKEIAARIPAEEQKVFSGLIQKWLLNK